jgi:hypothetical protein
VDGERPATFLAGILDADPDLHRPPLGQDHGSRDRQLVDRRRPDLLGRPQSQLGETGGGHDRGAEQRVVGQPGVGLQREAAGEQPALLTAGHRDRRPQQGVVGGALADRGGIARVRGGRLRPVVAALEGIGGELGQGGSAPAEEPAPLDRGAPGIGLGEGGQETPQAAFATAQRGGCADCRGVADELRGGLLDRHRQRRMGADLDEGVEAVADHGRDRPVEANRVAHRPVPVAGVELAAVERLAGHRGVEGRFARLRLDPCQIGQHAVADRLDLAGVAGAAESEVAGPHARRLAGLEQLLDRGRIAADDGGGGAVGDRQLDPPRPGFDPLQRLLRGEAQGDHRPLPDQIPLRPAAQGDDAGGVLEGEHPGDVGGGDLTL